MAMTPAERKQALADRGLTYEDIARRLRPKVSRKAVWANVHALPGQSSRRIQRAIANAIGRPVEEVFGAPTRLSA